MKISSKLLLALISLGISTTAIAQELTFGIKGGFNASHMIGDTKGSGIQPGFHLGVTVDYELQNNLYLLSGLEITTKGGSEKGDSGTRLSAWPMYLQLPLHVGRKFEISDKVKITVHGGPYAAYGITGRYKIKGSSGLNGSWDVFEDNMNYKTKILTGANGSPLLSKDILENPGMRPEQANHIVNLDSPFALGVESDWVNTKSVIANSGQQLMKKFDLGVGVGARIEFDEQFSINLGYEISALNAAKRTTLKHTYSDADFKAITDRFGDEYSEQIEEARATGSVEVYKSPKYKIRNGNFYIGIGVKF